MGGLEHRVARLGVIGIMLARGEIDRRQFPPFERVGEPLGKALFLLVLVAAQPIFEQQYAIVDEHLLECGDGFQECVDLVRGAKAHDLFDSGAVVIAAVEQHDLACSGEMLDKTLEIPLALLGLAWFAKGDGAALARVEPVGHRMDRAALARSIAAFEQDQNALSGLRHPPRHRHQLGLHRLEMLFIAFAVHRSSLSVRWTTHA